MLVFPRLPLIRPFQLSFGGLFNIQPLKSHIIVPQARKSCQTLIIFYSKYENSRCYILSHTFPTLSCILLFFSELCIFPKSLVSEILCLRFCLWSLASLLIGFLTLGRAFSGLMELFTVEECGRVCSR